MTQKSSHALLTSLLLSTSLVMVSPAFAKTATETPVKQAQHSKHVLSVQGKVRKNVNKKTRRLINPHHQLLRLAHF